MYYFLLAALKVILMLHATPGSKVRSCFSEHSLTGSDKPSEKAELFSMLAEYSRMKMDFNFRTFEAKNKSPNIKSSKTPHPRN